MARFALFARGISVLIYILLDAASEMISFWSPLIPQLRPIKIVMTRWGSELPGKKQKSKKKDLLSQLY